MQLLLVRWPDGRRLPPGAFGRCELLHPRRYAVVADPEEFDEWAAVVLGTGCTECGRASRATETSVKEKAVKELRPAPGVKVLTDGAVKLRVWPISVRNVDELERFVWESPLLLASEDSAKSRSQRRRRWRR